MQNLFKLFVLGSFLIPVVSLSQEINLDLLFNSWAISHNESTLNLVILRNSDDREYLNSDDRKGVYQFEIGLDSIIYDKVIKTNYSNFYCGPFNRIDVQSSEVWTLDYKKKRLRYDIFEDINDDENLPLYSSVYKIEAIRRNYLKLRLEKELFEGEE